MASTLYQSILERGEALGEARGEARRCADTIIRILVRRTGAIAPALAMRIRGVSSLDILDVWLNEAIALQGAEDARQLADKIGGASLA